MSFRVWIFTAILEMIYNMKFVLDSSQHRLTSEEPSQLVQMASHAAATRISTIKVYSELFSTLPELELAIKLSHRPLVQAHTWQRIKMCPNIPSKLCRQMKLQLQIIVNIINNINMAHILDIQQVPEVAIFPQQHRRPSVTTT